MRPSQPIRDRLAWGWEIHTVRGGINTGDIRVRHWVVGVVDVWIDSDPGRGGTILPRWRIQCLYKPWPMTDHAKYVFFLALTSSVKYLTAAISSAASCCI